jgi:fatty-acyl-CoA synthase
MDKTDLYVKDLYDKGLEKGPANFEPLTPLSFLERSALIYPKHPCTRHGDSVLTYAETYARARRLAEALVRRGIGKGDTVSIISSNVPAMFEAHFGVPMSGAVLNTMNVRLNADVLAYILKHSECDLLLTDTEFHGVVKDALSRLAEPPTVIDIDDPLGPGGERLGEIEYEALLAEGSPDYAWARPADEWDAISLNYTSGTTGRPKGVVYSHRGAYLEALSNVLAWGMGMQPVYLWTLPMFHANGWCFPWSLAAMAGTSVCLRRVEAGPVFRRIRDAGVTHFCGAPIVLNMLVNATDEEKVPLSRTVEVMTAGAAPPSSVIAGMEALGFNVTHVYGLTETYGPATLCAWHGKWDKLSLEERAALKSRQGVPYHALEGLTVADPRTLEPVAADGKTLGEVLMRGNLVMKGYLKNRQATAAAFEGGWFHSGDLAVLHPDGYIEVKDRSKDIIISGGENISSLEVEEALYKHPAVMEAAVVARPDEKWGESPCAFVTLKPEAQDVTEADIIEWCRETLARFKAPRTVIFGPLLKTSTGKIQKFILREKAKEL